MQPEAGDHRLVPGGQGQHGLPVPWAGAVAEQQFHPRLRRQAQGLAGRGFGAVVLQVVMGVKKRAAHG